jgi:uncharacterized protein YdhG (YjbR/CyaY superfamily)
MGPKRETPKSGKNAAASGKAKGFTEEERAAMRERAKEIQKEIGAKGQRGGSAKDADGEADLLAKIAEMPERDRELATRLHALIKDSAPELSSKTWYGMPAYAKNDNIVCFFQSSHRFKTRYATFGFSDKAHLDDGAMWPAGFALKELNADSEARIRALVKKAVG